MRASFFMYSVSSRPPSVPPLSSLHGSLRQCRLRLWTGAAETDMNTSSCSNSRNCPHRTTHYIRIYQPYSLVCHCAASHVGGGGGFKVSDHAGRLVLLFNATLAVFALTLAPSAFSTYGIIDKDRMYVTGWDLTVSFTPGWGQWRQSVCRFASLMNNTSVQIRRGLCMFGGESGSFCSTCSEGVHVRTRCFIRFYTGPLWLRIGACAYPCWGESDSVCSGKC